MKQLKMTLLIGLLSLILAPSIVAQNIDAHRMKRDIRIMENILSELFRTQTEIATPDSYSIIRGEFGQRSIRGTYLKDFGIIFMIQKNDPFTPRMDVDRDIGFSFYYSTNSDDSAKEASRTVDEESINKRMTEFLINYGSIIGQLDDDERIMLVYDSNPNFKRARFVGYMDNNGRNTFEEETKGKLPVLSASVSMQDLINYRSGTINNQEIVNRINFASSESQHYTDLEVMGNIFETALRESAENTFRANGKIGYMMLDNFGAIFSFDARYSGNGSLFYGRFPEGQRILRNFQNRIANVRMEQSFDTAEEKEAFEKREKEFKEGMIAAFEKLKKDIAQYMVDYGRTITSVDSDQYVLTSINLSSNGMDEIPNRIDFQIKKSALEDYDQGKITREQAIDSVSVTYY